MERKAKSGKNTRKKQKDQAAEEPEDAGASLLKRNELSIIFIGAGILTVVIFFIFFNPSGANRDNNTTDHKTPSKTGPDTIQLQKRINRLEAMVKENSAAGTIQSGENLRADSAKTSNSETMSSFRQRLERVETALSVKLEAVNKRIDSLEKSMAELSDTISSLGSAAGTTGAVEEKRVSGDVKKKSMFHTVQKGDTLYSISRKYNVSVDKLRKLNNLDKDSSIYPGDNLVVK